MKNSGSEMDYSGFELIKSFFRTGFVLELECNQYFAHWHKGKVASLPLERARYFPTMKTAEQYVHKYLGFVGMRIKICRVCWTLVETESMENEKIFIKDENGIAAKFATYQEAMEYQRVHLLQKNSAVDIFAFPEKEILLVA